jgi:Nucleotidyl transferase AbiEii toxin, Type IV TA system
MLHLETVFPATWELLKNLMSIPELAEFNLAGGTSLSLQIGHRLSVDLDFFGKRPFESQEILDLVHPFGTVKMMSQRRNILVLDINGVKVDFVNYSYLPIEPVLHQTGIRLLGLPDIAAMKLAAIAGRGRKRDFIDLFFLLKNYKLAELLTFYNRKFPDGSEFMVVKSLTYFEDADQDENPKMLQKLDWQKVKNTIQKEVKKIS